jgi:cbb3-type cytochrome oxidase subunit 3
MYFIAGSIVLMFIFIVITTIIYLKEKKREKNEVT